MADSPTSENPSLDADDPRISEWIDGRLGPTEAAEIERGVESSPELAAIVADLRTIRRVMRAATVEESPVDLGDRVMAAIPGAHAGGQRIARSVTPPGANSHRRRPLPWLALAGALAAGLLVTVVVNRPADDGREVALVSHADKPSEAIDARAVRLEDGIRRELKDVVKSDQLATDKEVESLRRAMPSSRPSADDLASEPADHDRSLEENSPTEAAANSAVAEREPPLPAIAAQEGSSADGLARLRGTDVEASSGAIAGGGFGGGVPQGLAASAPPAAAAPQPQLPRAAKALADAAATPAEAAAADALELPNASAKKSRAKSRIAGVLVIAITSPSERRALDQLVAASGLEATPEKDHLALVGPSTAVDAFLDELDRVGLVAAVPGRKSAAGKLKGERQQGDEQASLILRVVERKAKQPAEAQAGEAGEKP